MFKQTRKAISATREIVFRYDIRGLLQMRRIITGAIISWAAAHCDAAPAPTSTPERLKLIATYSTGFVYLVSRTGVTGEQTALSESLGTLVKSMRAVVRGNGGCSRGG